MNTEAMETTRDKEGFAKLAAAALAILLSLAAIGLAGCASDDGESSGSADEGSSSLTDLDMGSADYEEYAIDETTIFEGDEGEAEAAEEGSELTGESEEPGVILTAESAMEADGGVYLLVTATNNSETDVYISNDGDFTVGDASSAVTLSVEAAAGETTQVHKMYFEGIDSVEKLYGEEISGSIVVTDRESGTELYDRTVSFTIEEASAE